MKFVGGIILAVTLLLNSNAAAAAGAPRAFDRAARAHVVTDVNELVGQYTFAEKVPALRATLAAKRNKYLAIGDAQALSKVLTDDLYAVAHDKHLTLFHAREPFAHDTSMTKAELARMSTGIAYDNAGYHVVARLRGNIGYIKVDGFAPMPQAQAAIDGTMREVAKTDALIIDLRTNHGGIPDSLDYLMGYFFARPVELTSIQWKPAGQREQTYRQFSAAHVHGSRYLDRPIFLLTSESTVSCAEQFAYDMQSLHRATVIGATTAGGANPGALFPLSDAHFALFVPLGRAYNPYTKTNWEGVGVIPDRHVETAKALVSAYTSALAEAKNSFPRVRDEREEALQHPATALRSSLPM